MQATPQLKDLVLVGGGHAHVQVLRSFRLRPMPGVRLTLVTRELETPYYGRIAGLVSGRHSFEQSHIDLARLCAWSGARLIAAEAMGIDRTRRRVLLKDRPPLAYDVLSLDVGAAPSLAGLPGAERHAIAVKPIAAFGRRWLEFAERVQQWQGPLGVVVVGGGAGGVELALALDHTLRRIAKAAQVTVTLVTRQEILIEMAEPARERMRALLRRRRLGLIEHKAASRIDAGRLDLETGEWLAFDAAFLATEGAAQPWFADTGLMLDDKGFIAIDQALRTSDPAIFATGDCATVPTERRPKSGLQARRQGPPLAANLRRALAGRRPKRRKPPGPLLSVVGTADGGALATRGEWAIESGWARLWKDRIDARWMRHHGERPRQTMATPAITPDPALADPQALRLLGDAGRMGGAGAKVGAASLARVLDRLDLPPGDDAAPIEVPAGRLLVQSVDFLRSLCSDPCLFGEIAAIHALGDIWAMGAEPLSALALAVVPAAAERLMEEDLFQLLAGARRALDQAGCALIGGHSAEGAETALGFAVNGLAEPGRLLTKGGLRPGDRLVLGKPLGNGVILAAAGRGTVPARWIAEALDGMRRPSAAAAAALLKAGAHAATDVTGFGLAGHLAEMVRATSEPVSVELRLESLPALKGAVELFAQGYASALQAENARVRELIAGFDQAARHAKLPLLFDPQTAGGLLAALPAGVALPGGMVEIGTVRERASDEPPIRLVA